MNKMESLDRHHLIQAIEQFSLYLLNGLIAKERDFSSGSGFVEKVVLILSKANDELSCLSSGLKEKMTFIQWDLVEKMRHPDNIRREIIRNPHGMYIRIRTEIPLFLDKLKGMLNEEK